MKKLFILMLSSHLLFSMGNDNINYDEQFDRVDESLSEAGVEADEGTSVEELETIVQSEPIPAPQLDKSEILSKLKLQTYAFQERNGKNIPVRYVTINSPVIYLNRVINQDDTDKQNIIVKNPIPRGAEYVRGSATCGDGCRILYSNDNGETLLPYEEGRVNYIEFVFDDIPAEGEVRMGFRAVIRGEGG